MARGAAVCCLAVFLLLAAVAVFASGASDPLTAVKATDRGGAKETSDLLPVHRDSGKEDEEANTGRRRGDAAGEVASLASTEEEGGKVGSDWGSKAKKLNDHDDSDSDHDHDSDHDSDSDHDHDSDHDSDSDHDHDHDSDHDSDSDHDHDHDSDHDSDSDHDHDHDSNSDHDSDSDSDDDQDDDNSKHGSKKKHAVPGRKATPGGKHDDDLPKSVIKV